MNSDALTILICLLLCGVLAGGEEAKAPASSGPGMLKSLRAGHPRLVALEEDLKRVKGLIETNPVAKEYFAALKARAAKMVNEPLLQYELQGPRLLHISRRALDRIYTLGLVFRLEPDDKLADRAVRELLNVCAFKDWHPPHFLDTAEMTHAVAIGYDWLYDRLTPDQRKTIREAIVQKGLLAAKKVYHGDGWWAKCTHNWNQVCNGGISIGALAIADEEPALAEYTLEKGRHSIIRAMRSYEPEGGWNEGPGYWNYATSYTVFYFAALQSALGTDFGLVKEVPAFAKAGDFRLWFCGPVGLTFNYADAGAGSGRAAEMSWLARCFDRPIFAWHERSCGGGPSALDLLWFDPRGEGPRADRLPLDSYVRGVEVAFFRSAWEDREAVFVGFKGGDNAANHSHLDLGSFVLDALGARWALDLGGDDYNLPGYFGRQRWTYYRLMTEGHNTLTIGGENQQPRAKAPILAFGSQPEKAFAVADLTAAYPQATRWWRGMALLDRREVLVQDEIELKAPAEVAWHLHTEAKVEAAGPTATLRRGDAALRLTVLEPAGAKFEAAPAQPPAPQNPNKGVTRITVRLPAAAKARIAVLMTPYRGAAPAASRAVTPLAEWEEKK